jgi:dephospho-CoA kinase
MAKPIIGLAGGIGAGKSTVATLMGSLGAVVIESDRLSHEELSSPEVLDILRSWWGEAVVQGGKVDRSAIARIVFSESEARARLEQLLYPRIEARRERLIAQANADVAVRAIVLDSPKLFETGLDERCDAVVYVEVDREARVERVIRTRGWSADELARREKLQNALDSKRTRADYVIANNSSLDALRIKVENVFSTVLAECSA